MVSRREIVDQPANPAGGGTHRRTFLPARHGPQRRGALIAALAAGVRPIVTVSAQEEPVLEPGT